MMTRMRFTFIVLVTCLVAVVNAQQTTLTRDQIIAITPERRGERLPDGRPYVSEKLLERLKNTELAKKGGVVFIPPHLLEQVVLNAEFISLRDQFGHQHLREGKYTPGQIDRQWTDDIKADFLKWLDQNPDKLPMTREELDAFMKNRTW